MPDVRGRGNLHLARPWHRQTCSGGRHQLAAALEVLGNVGFCADERLPGDGDDALIRPAGRAWRQLVGDCGGDVSSNNGEIAVFKLEDIRAALEGRGLLTAQMRVWTKSA